MKLLVICPDFPPTKVPEADHAYYLCEGLATQGFEVHVLTRRRGELVVPKGVVVHALARDWTWWDAFTLASVVKEVAPSYVLLIYIGGLYGEHPMITFAATICKWVHNPCVFVTQFEDPFGARPHTSSPFSRVVRKILAYWLGKDKVSYEFGSLMHESYRVIVLSLTNQNRLASSLPWVASKCVLIPPPPLIRAQKDPDLALRSEGRRSLGIRSNEFLITYFGYIYWGKGVDTLLKAFDLLKKKRVNVRLLLLGGSHVINDHPDYLLEIENLIKESNGDGSIIRSGEFPFDSPETSHFLYASDLCVLPFDVGVRLNNSSFAVATAHGLPVLTTRGAEIDPQFENLKNVYLCAPRDPRALADSIETLIESSDLRESLSAGSLKFAAEWYSWEKAIRETAQAFHMKLA